MLAQRFLTWLYYMRGLDVDNVQSFPVEQRNALVSHWIKLGMPHAYSGE